MVDQLTQKQAVLLCISAICCGCGYYAGMCSKLMSLCSGDGSLSSSLLASYLSSEKGLFISRLFQTHQTALVEQIAPCEVATSLYNLALLENAELYTLNAFEERDRAMAIVLHLQKILRFKPELFSDVYAALKKAGVRVVQDIKGISVSCSLTMLFFVVAVSQLLYNRVGGTH